MSGLGGREMEWDERTRGAQGERDLIVLGAVELGRGGNLDKIDQFIKLFFSRPMYKMKLNPSTYPLITPSWKCYREGFA
jgi:hypothetical protein